MALAAGLRLARVLLRPNAGPRGAAPGGLGARCFGSPRVLVEPGPAAGVAVVKLKSPPVNCLSLELLTELIISLEKLENDKTFRGIVLTSVGAQ